MSKFIVTDAGGRGRYRGTRAGRNQRVNPYKRDMQDAVEMAADFFIALRDKSKASTKKNLDSRRDDDRNGGPPPPSAAV